LDTKGGATMKERQNFIYRPEWMEEILRLPDDLRLKVNDAIIRFALYGEEPEDDAVRYSCFGLIRRQIIEDREKYAQVCEANRANIRKRWNKDDTVVYERIQTKHNSNNNSKSNCNNNISLSLTPSREVVREDGGVTAAEKERFFEIFFFRNFVYPDKEVERFVDFYSATGWRRHGDVRVVQDRQALARQWKPENPENGCGRFPQAFLRAFEIAYAEIRTENADDARMIIHGIHKVEISVDKTRICCANGIPPVMERYAAILNAANVPLGRQLIYAQLRN